MDHPLVSEHQKSLRRQVIQLFQRAYTVRRASNIVFVCGGNDDVHMRRRFCGYCQENLLEYEIFLPESAMGNISSNRQHEPFDIVDFELLIGELSHAIVIFPEAAGSFAETGYFAATEALSAKTILVLDSNRQREDSFISLGPARKIAKKSVFDFPLQLNYNDPDFSSIVARIKRVREHKNKKSLIIKKFKELTSYELSAIIHEIVSICSICTFDDILYILRGIFSGHISSIRAQRLVSILVGASFLNEIGDYGHVTTNRAKPRLLEIKDGFREKEAEIRLSLAHAYHDTDVEFLKLVEASRDAH